METTHESPKQTLCSAQPAKPYAFSRKVFCEGMRDGCADRAGVFCGVVLAGHRGPDGGFYTFAGLRGQPAQQCFGGRVRRLCPHCQRRDYLEVAIITLIANAPLSADELCAGPAGSPPVRPFFPPAYHRL